jgi:hypothetical protein
MRNAVSLPRKKSRSVGSEIIEALQSAVAYTKVPRPSLDASANRATGRSARAVRNCVGQRAVEEMEGF